MLEDQLQLRTHIERRNFLPRALEDQLGLTLKESEVPFDVIVIDGAERPQSTLNTEP